MAKSDNERTSTGRDRRGGRRPPLRLLVVRHAIAEDRADSAGGGRSDADRPLTKDGRRKMRRAARGLLAVVPDLHVVATSPLARAVETAAVIVARYAEAGDEPGTVRLSALSPGKPANVLLGWVAERPRDGGAIAIVGHEPHLGQFVSWALTGLRESFVELKKGQAVLLEFADEVRPGRAKLVWSLRPGQLRKIGRGAKHDG